MQRAFATDTRLATPNRATAVAVVAMLAALMLALAPATRAQEATPPAPAASPAASPAAATDQLGTVLIQHDVAAMPNAPMTVRLLRITLEPGASVPMHTHPGLEFDYVESGTLTTRSDGDVVISVGGEQSTTSEPQALGEGDWVHYPTGTGMNLANEGDAPLVLLSAVVLSVGADTQSTITYTEGDPTDADFEGVSFVVLGDGLIQQFPEGGATVTVDELTVAAGQPVPGFDGVAMLSKASGTFAFAAGEGLVQVTRTATPQLQPNAIPGQEFTLADNDAAFFPAGYQAIERPDSTGDLTLTRLLIKPTGDLAEAPATVTTIQAVETAQQPAGGGIGVGAIVAISEDGVRLRQTPSTNGEIVDSYPAGTQFEIIAGPEEADGYTWYQVRGVGDLSGTEGWLVTDFMDVIEPAAGAQGAEGTGGATPTPAAGTPAAGTPTAAGEFKVGDTVTTTVENLRIRAEPSTEGEALNTLPLGSQLEIIGGPTEAETYTWYQVRVVDTGAEGWVASDFLEKAGGQ